MNEDRRRQPQSFFILHPSSFRRKGPPMSSVLVCPEGHRWTPPRSGEETVELPGACPVCGAPLRPAGPEEPVDRTLALGPGPAADPGERTIAGDGASEVSNDLSLPSMADPSAGERTLPPRQQLVSAGGALTADAVP